MTQTWITDDDGNRCSVEYFGSREGAQRALNSLKNCRDCTNCSDCYYCSDCSRCSRCSHCYRCSRCSDCSGRMPEAKQWESARRLAEDDAAKAVGEAT